MHSRRIAFKVHPVSRTPSFVNRCGQIGDATGDPLSNVSFRCGRYRNQIGAALNLREQLEISADHLQAPSMMPAVIPRALRRPA